MNITRTTNANGTYRYEIDGELHTKASKVLYTHATSYRVGDRDDTEPVMFHKTAAAAAKATGYKHLGWVKTGVYEIAVKTPADYVTTPPHIAGDPAPEAAPELPAKGTAVRVNANYRPGTYMGHTGTVVRTDPGDDGNTYVMVDLGGFTWPFLAGELDRVEDDAAEEVTAEDIEMAREVTRAMFSTPAKAPAKTPAPKVPAEDAAGYLYAVEANGSGVAYPVRAATMHDAIRAVHTESRRPVIVDGLTPDRGYTTNVDDAGAWHFIVDEVNAYTVRRLETPAEAATVRVRRLMDGEAGTLREITEHGWIVDMDHGTDVLGTRRAWAILPPAVAASPAKPAAPGYRRGTAVEYRAPGQGTWRPAVVESVRVSDNAVMVKRPDGTRDAAPARDVRLAPAEAASYLAGRRHLAR